MRTLYFVPTRRMHGSDVLAWQRFMGTQQILIGRPDSFFGPRTHTGTVAFQQRHNLTPDGIVGPRTQAAAAQIGFRAPSGPSPSNTVTPAPAPRQPRVPRPIPPPPSRRSVGRDWYPPRPSFSALGPRDRERIFGKFSYVPAPVAGNRERIRITDNWASENIVTVTIPQLQGVTGAPGGGRVQWHKKGAGQLVALWADWERAGLLSLVLTWAGSFVPRFQRGSSTALSNHAWGTAFDINAAWNGLGSQPAAVGVRGSVLELVPIAHSHGFYWGGHFSKRRSDGMHFEMAVIK